VNQKSYILEVFQKVKLLTEKHVAMTDLKPENTLFDTENKTATIIDLGGSIRIDEDMISVDLRRYPIQYTEAYAAKELREIDSTSERRYNVLKSLSYSCGKVLFFLIDAMKDRKLDSRTSEIYSKLQEIVKEMTKNEDDPPESRMDIETAIKLIEKIGDYSRKNELTFEIYKNKVQNRLQEYRSSLHINEDIHETIQAMIPPQVSELDPEVYKNSIVA
jgi:serine/threonine protein kinase